MGFFELLLIAIVTLLVVGPEKLPETIRTISINLHKVKRFWQNAKREVEREVGMDDIRREIHNAEVMENLEKARKMQLKHLEEFGDTGLDKDKKKPEAKTQSTQDNQVPEESPDDNRIAPKEENDKPKNERRPESDAD